MKKQILFIAFILCFFTAKNLYAQNDLKARVEYESAEQSYNDGNYTDAFAHLQTVDNLLGKWTPKVGYLKIKTLDKLTRSRVGYDTVLKNEINKYMAYANANQDKISIDNFKDVYAIQKDSAAIENRAQSLFKTELKDTMSEISFFNLNNVQSRLANKSVSAISAEYAAAFNAGTDAFMQGRYEEAYNDFYKAAQYSFYIIRNGLSSNPDIYAIDSAMVMYTGFAAQKGAGFATQTGFKNPNMGHNAVTIYTILINRGIHIPQMTTAYQFLIQYYQFKQDSANASKYLALAKQYYPDKSDVWSSL